MSSSSSSTIIQIRTQHLTTVEVHVEARLKYGASLGEISNEAAVTVASWWQSAGSQGAAFAALASGAEVSASALLEDIHQTRQSLAISAGIDAICLDLLGTWVLSHA